ncbi:pseudouridine synthase [Pleionea litopenaei]|uniref:Pseudouridine synthase n=1 Tax=Pleionea litopenaei TaxID=3070815 RepID=A0AA51RRX4_9GAMM|nr:pseudouridine synthase [Pleionea sp. HL-JVS1]WMS86384.1 pseudouridine synthase [Pleionea sp. HL-JVS1]
MEVSILEETLDWLAINKPIDSSIHSEQGVGLIAELKHRLNLEFLAPVHRLDKVTSGVLLLAKNSQAAAQLSQQFADREVNKIYIALTEGKPNKKQGCIKGDMEPARNGNWMLTRKCSNPAITYFYSLGYQHGVRLALLKPVTGKTHQLRVAMKSNGAPILGDTRYGKKDNASDRCYLHHYCLTFNDHGQRHQIKAPFLSGRYFLETELHTLIEEQLEKVGW